MPLDNANDDFHAATEKGGTSVNQFTLQLDKKFLDAVERTVAEACEEIRRSSKRNSAGANWAFFTKSAWDEAIEEAIGHVLDQRAGSVLGLMRPASQQVARSRDRTLNRL